MRIYLIIFGGFALLILALIYVLRSEHKKLPKIIYDNDYPKDDGK